MASQHSTIGSKITFPLALLLCLCFAFLATHPAKARSATTPPDSNPVRDKDQANPQPATDVLRVIYSFPAGSAGVGGYPNGDLIFDAAGNLYGTSYFGGSGCGSAGCGTVFRLSPNANGTWKHITLFKFNGANGENPHTGLTFDGAGNLYGTTSNDNSCGCGTVFRLSPQTNGAWKLTTLIAFNGKNGNDPEGRLSLDAGGDIYGTTSGGGNFGSACPATGCGTVFRLSPLSDGSWKQTILFAFSGANGVAPLAGAIFDSAGNLYGTTSAGGTGCPSGGCGTVFRLSPETNGNWKHSTLATFRGKNGAYPLAGLIFDKAGNLYGTTLGGGICLAGACGTVFELTLQANRTWKVNTLLAFAVTDGSNPQSDLIFDPSGNLYGTAQDGSDGLGVVFELSPQTDGTWMDTTLGTFTGGNGAQPFGGVVRDAAGNLYGATIGGGRHGGGVVFEVENQERR